MQSHPPRLAPPPLPNSYAATTVPALTLLLLGTLALSACGGGSGTAETHLSTALDAATAAAAGAGAASGALAAASSPEAGASGTQPAASTAAANITATHVAVDAAPAVSAMAATASATPMANAAKPATAVPVSAVIVSAPMTALVAAPVAAPVAADPAPAPALAPAPTPAPALAPAPAVVTYSARITISKGGTYSGNWESTNPAVAAVTITTADPVVIQNCNIRSVGGGIQSVYSGTQVTVRNCKGLMKTPNVAGKAAGRFLSLYGPKSLVAENNDITGGSGFYADGGGKGADLIRIRYNKQLNVDGRQSDGKGGYLATYNIAQFLQLNNVQGITDGEVSWNQVINQPYESRVEDNINLYLTRGLSTRKFPVHDNYIQGAYPADPVKDGFSGGGIIVDGSATTAGTAAAYLSITNNQVVSTTNHGIAISAGINGEIKGNRVVSTGTLPTGERLAAANVGIYIWDVSNNITTGSFYGNVASGNAISWINQGGQRNDSWLPNCASGGCTGNRALTTAALTALAPGATLVSAKAASPSASSVEDVEYSNWQAKLSSNAVKVGTQ